MKITFEFYDGFTYQNNVIPVILEDMFKAKESGAYKQCGYRWEGNRYYFAYWTKAGNLCIKEST